MTPPINRNHRPDGMPGGFAFDYEDLPASLRAAVRGETDAIRDLLARNAQNVVQIGLRLRFVRDRVGRRRFQPWLKAEFRWTASVASNYMRAAAEFADLDCLDRFQPSALFTLARKKATPEARAQAIRLARAGSRITKSVALELVARHGQGAKTRPPSGDRLHGLQRAVGQLSLAEAEALAEEISRVLRRLRTEVAETEQRMAASSITFKPPSVSTTTASYRRPMRPPASTRRGTSIDAEDRTAS